MRLSGCDIFFYQGNKKIRGHESIAALMGIISFAIGLVMATFGVISVLFIYYLLK